MGENVDWRGIFKQKASGLGRIRKTWVPGPVHPCVTLDKHLYLSGLSRVNRKDWIEIDFQIVLR